MGSASRYWLLVRIDGTGRRRVDEIAIAKAFFDQHFADRATQSAVSNASIQKELWQRLRSAVTSAAAERDGAELCLRCYISHQIEQVCVQLAAKFGTRYGFSRYDLFPFVLNDNGQQIFSHCSDHPYRSLASQILSTFDPSRAGLNTWIMRQVRHERDLNAFLQEHGVYLATDWGILNDTSPNQLRRVLSAFHTTVPAELEIAYQLLQGYHDVYRQDRLQQRQAGILKGKEECLAPTSEQLARIADHLQQCTSVRLSNESILGKLQAMATQLRQYRLYVRSGRLPAESLEQPKNQALAAAIQAPEPDADSEAQQEFLTFYRQQFLSCLDQAIEQVTEERFTYLQRKNPQTAQQFLQALHLFHCQGQSMGAIAPQIGLQAQFQVTRLMKLKEFRASVQSKLLQLLLDCIREKAKNYADHPGLHALDAQIEAALGEQISSLLQQAEAEAAVAKHCPLTSVFARRLCHYLDTRSITS